MNALILNRKCRKLMSFGFHAVRVTFADALLCAVCGALYGMVLGGFGAQARHQLSSSVMFSIAVNYALVGFAIGAAVGAVREVSRVRKILRRLSQRATRTAARFAEQPQSRLSEPATRSVPRNALIITASQARPRITALGG